MKLKSRLITLASILLFATKLSALELVACDQLMLVSAYFSNNVYVFNACDGTFLQELDDTGRIRGAQATRIGPDGNLYVVSERNDKILRYDAISLEFIDEFVAANLINEPTGLAFGPDGNLYIASFSGDQIIKVDGNTGAVLGQFANGIDGPDAGMDFGPDGNLYVPSYNGNSISVLNGSTGALVRTISGQLANPRVIAFEPESGNFLVSVWGSGSISRYTSNGNFDRFITNNFSSVAGLAFRNDGALFAISSTVGQARMVNPANGELGELFTDAAGISGATFITFVDYPSSEPVATNQFWAVGAGDITGLSVSLSAESMIFASGTVFGEAFDPAAITRHPFGTIDITLTSCTEASFTYNTAGHANMGNGSYPLVKVAQNTSMTECLDLGFNEATTSQNALTGAWYGGPGRDGEGFFIDTLDNGKAVIAWFTFGTAATAPSQ